MAGAATTGFHTQRSMVAEELVFRRIQDQLLTPVREADPHTWDAATRAGAMLSDHDAINIALARSKLNLSVSQLPQATAKESLSGHDQPLPGGSRRTLRRETSASLQGCGSVRGSPKCRKTPVSANQVTAAIASPASVSTMSPYGRAIAACASGR